MPRPPTVLRLAHGRFRIDVESDDRPALGWLREFLVPAFSVRRSGRAGARATFVVSRAEHARLARAHRRARTRPVEAFTLDGGFVVLPGTTTADGATRVRDDRSGAFAEVASGGRAARVVAARGDDVSRVLLLRVVREAATAAALRAGRLPLHGAAFVVAGGAFLVCGPKRAGKTSVLARALEQGAAYLAGDRLFLDGSRTPRARGMPTIVMVRDGTLSLFPRLAAAFERSAFDRARTIRECAPGVRRPRPRARPGFDRPGISPAQLARLFRARLAGGAPVRAVLFPAIGARARGVSLRRLSRREAAARLLASLLRPSRPTRVPALFAKDARPEAVPARAEARRCRAAAARVPAFELRLGPDAYAGDLLGEVRRYARAAARASSRKERSVKPVGFARR